MLHRLPSWLVAISTHFFSEKFWDYNFIYFRLFCILKIKKRNLLSQVIDFGASCFEHQRIYSYIQSRFYRAPEVILGARYGTPIDMWSFGCILAELLTGRPLFPGENEEDQLACILEVLGMPPEKFLAECKRKNLFFNARGLPRFGNAFD